MRDVRRGLRDVGDGARDLGQATSRELGGLGRTMRAQAQARQQLGSELGGLAVRGAQDATRDLGRFVARTRPAGPTAMRVGRSVHGLEQSAMGQGRDLGRGIATRGRDVVSAGREIGQDVGSGAKQVGRDLAPVGAAASKAAGTVKKTSKKVGKTLKKVFG